MNRQALLRIWRDPVWSKIISVVLLGLITILYNLIISIFSKTNFKFEFYRFWTIKIELWLVAVIGLLTITSFWTISYSLKKRPYKYDSTTLELDRNLFNNIRNEVLPQDIILEVKQSSFAGNDFPGNLLFKVLEILSTEKRADFHFFNPVLDKSKTKLIEEVEKFEEITRQYIFGATGTTMLGIPKEWVHEQPERFKEAVSKIYDQEIILLNSYDKFIRLGRQILKV